MRYQDDPAYRNALAAYQRGYTSPELGTLLKAIESGNSLFVNPDGSLNDRPAYGPSARSSLITYTQWANIHFQKQDDLTAYLLRYPDLAAYFREVPGTGPSGGYETVWQHWQNTGQYEGRLWGVNAIQGQVDPNYVNGVETRYLGRLSPRTGVDPYGKVYPSILEQQAQQASQLAAQQAEAQRLAAVQAAQQEAARVAAAQQTAADQAAAQQAAQQLAAQQAAYREAQAQQEARMLAAQQEAQQAAAQQEAARAAAQRAAAELQAAQQAAAAAQTAAAVAQTTADQQAATQALQQATNRLAAAQASADQAAERLADAQEATAEAQRELEEVEVQTMVRDSYLSGEDDEGLFGFDEKTVKVAAIAAAVLLGLYALGGKGK